jgi:hypothetical protein
MGPLKLLLFRHMNRPMQTKQTAAKAFLLTHTWFQISAVVIHNGQAHTVALTQSGCCQKVTGPKGPRCTCHQATEKVVVTSPSSRSASQQQPNKKQKRAHASSSRSPPLRRSPRLAAGGHDGVGQRLDGGIGPYQGLSAFLS